MLSAHAITARVGGRVLLRDATVQVKPGELRCVVGPNGAGKTTLLRTLTGALRVTRGHVSMNGRDIGSLSAAEMARQRAVVPQAAAVSPGHSVIEIVQMGRNAHAKLGDVAEARAVHIALKKADAAELAPRMYDTLSGGERQRVQLARALAQLHRFQRSSDGGAAQSQYLLLDEPTANLDLQHQHNLFALAQQLAREGLGVFCIAHDLNLALQYADRVTLLHLGAVVADGAPADVLQPALLREVFGVDSTLIQHPTQGRMVIVI